MSGLLAFVRCRIEILQLNVRTGLLPESENFAYLCRDLLKAVREMCLSVPSVSAPEVGEILTLLADAPMPDDVKGELRNIFNAKLAQGGQQIFIISW